MYSAYISQCLSSVKVMTFSKSYGRQMFRPQPSRYGVGNMVYRNQGRNTRRKNIRENIIRKEKYPNKKCMTESIPYETGTFVY